MEGQKSKHPAYTNGLFQPFSALLFCLSPSFRPTCFHARQAAPPSHPHPQQHAARRNLKTYLKTALGAVLREHKHIRYVDADPHHATNIRMTQLFQLETTTTTTQDMRIVESVSNIVRYVSGFVSLDNVSVAFSIRRLAQRQEVIPES